MSDRGTDGKQHWVDQPMRRKEERRPLAGANMTTASFHYAAQFAASRDGSGQLPASKVGGTGVGSGRQSIIRA
jgi:hypothetical protein